MLRFGMTKTAKGEFYDEKKKKKMGCDVHNIVI